MTQLIIFLPEKSTLIRKIIVIFMLLVGGAQQGFAQPDCPSILFTLIDQDPCCYQLNLENLSDCTPELRILLDVGQFTSFVADVGNGFTVTSVTQTELLLTHSSGIIPFGTSAPLEFCIEPGTTPIFTILYDITCGLGQSCFYEVALAGCAAQDTCMAEFTFPADFCGQIQFVNTSTGPAPLSFTWDFGDPGSIPNNTSVLKDPWHKFTACGQYNVCLTINGGMCNSTVCHLVNIVDNNPPVALCKNGVMIPLGANCQANVTSALIDDGSFDDCLIQSMSVSPNVITGCGSFPVVLTVTDWCGNTNSCTTDVQGVDNIPPIIFCPADLHLSTTGPNCSMIVQGIQPVLVDDNCGTPLLSYVVSGASSYAGNGSASGLSFDAGTSFVTYTATDNCGNIASCSFKIVVDCICHCQNNLIQNSGFDQGSIMGNLGFNLWPGHTNNWFRISETPHLDGTTFCCDPFSMYFFAFATGGESIYQPGIPFLAGHTYKISYCSKSNLFYRFQATNSPVPGFYNPYNCTNCQIMGTSPQATTAAWNTYTMPLWTATQNADVLVIVGLGNGCCGYHNKGWIDNICLQEIQYSCCTDQKAFDDNSSLIVNIQVDQSVDSVRLNVGSLLACNRVTYIDWGDGTPITSGPIDANTRLTHSYPDNNVYEIQYLIQEFITEDSSQVCFEKLFSETVQILPDSCFCNAFSSMFIRSSQGAMSIPVSCGGAPLTLACPPAGTGFSFTGLFECIGMTCQDTSTISWRLTGPQGSEVGLAATNPYFSIDLLPRYFTFPGVYTLSISGFCGNEICDCEIQLIVECQDLCACTTQDIEAFEAAVDAGFTQTIFNNSCKACFTPIALTDCETVTWYINDTMSTPIGYTIGNQSFCYSFPSPDDYSIIMQVDRVESMLQTCTTFSYERRIETTCVIAFACTGGALNLNPSFQEGAISGDMSNGGSTDHWIAISGSPHLLDGIPGSTDGWTIQLTGNLSEADVLASADPICFPLGRGKVTGKSKVGHSGDPHENLNGKHMKDWEGKLVLFQGDDFEFGNCPANSCYEIASIDFSQVDTGWFEFQIEYDLDQWVGAATCLQPGSEAPGIEARLAIYVTSPYTSDQGGVASQAKIQVDDICFSELLVSVPSIEQNNSLHIFPNPNNGEFTLELSELTSQDMSISVISLTGQILYEKKAEVGTNLQRMEIKHLSQGMYFIQILSENSVVGMSRFVKQ